MSAGRPAHSHARDQSVEAVRERKREVVELLYARGFSHGRIKREMAAKHNLSERQVGRYIRVVEGQFKRDNESDPGMPREQYREMITDMIAEFRALGSPAAVSAAARLTETLGKMHGHLTERVEVEHKGELQGPETVRLELAKMLHHLGAPARVVESVAVEQAALPAKGEK
jgi:hypothetical protein